MENKEIIEVVHAEGEKEQDSGNAIPAEVDSDIAALKALSAKINRQIHDFNLTCLPKFRVWVLPTSHTLDLTDTEKMDEPYINLRMVFAPSDYKAPALSSKCQAAY